MQQVAKATADAKAAGTFIPPFPGAEDLWANIIPKTGLRKGNLIPSTIGQRGTTDADNYFFPQFYLAHNHDDCKVTNNGVYPGGQLILIETDCPGSDYTATPPVITEPPHTCPASPIP